ncbi:MAG TPA: serine hydrolase domain-containing protein [Pseudomonadales bacterium]
MRVDVAVERGRVLGHCETEFTNVVDTFVENFAARGEVGAALCINIAGDTVVDVWGGRVAQDDAAAPWTDDTISLVYSCTKAATALCAHMLIDRGHIDLHAPVSTYWPEFAANGKESATVAMLLNHSVGVPALREPVKEGGFYDWDYMAARVAAEKPFWEPGTRNGYHMATFGWTVGELVRRVSGRSLGTFFREEVAEPLELDFWIGLPDVHIPRVAPMIPWVPERGGARPPFTRALLTDPKSIPSLAFLNRGNHKADSPLAYASEFGAGGGIANARALAGMYTPLANGGEHAGVRLVSADHIVRMREISTATQLDATLLMPTRFSLGFMRSMDNRHRPTGDMESGLLGAAAFGHAGAGGSIGFADPSEALAFGYSMNKMGAGILLNPRGQLLVDATYRALGYRTNEPGVWIR